MFYYLYYDYGTHKLAVQVSPEDFHRVADDLSIEFEIHKSDAHVGVTEYWFFDYLNNPYAFGFVSE